MKKNELRSALEELNRRDMEKLPSLEELEDAHEFSEEYEKKMHKVIRKWNRKYVKGTNYTLKTSWVAAAVLTITLSLTMTVKASREAIIQFVVEMFEKYSSIGHDAGDLVYAPDVILEYREPDWGNEYEETDRKYYSNSLWIMMQNSNGVKISFSQKTMLYKDSQVNTENVTLHDVVLENGQEVKSFINKGMAMVFWNDSEYYYELSGNCNTEILYELAETLK